jgi:hypothetical protein
MKTSTALQTALTRRQAGTLAAILAALLAAGLFGPAQPEHAPGMGLLRTSGAEAFSVTGGAGVHSGFGGAAGAPFVAIPN